MCVAAAFYSQMLAFIVFLEALPHFIPPGAVQSGGKPFFFYLF
jgi:hypothetical protein